MAAKPAPRADVWKKSDAMQVYTDVSALSADPDLTALSGKPKWAPQKTTIWAAAALTIVLVDEDNVTHSILVSTVPIVITRPIKTIDESASGAVNVIFEWFDPQGSTDWNK